MPRELKWWVFREKREVYSRYVDVTKCMYNGVAIYGTIRGIVYWVRQSFFHHQTFAPRRQGLASSPHLFYFNYG